MLEGEGSYDKHAEGQGNDWWCGLVGELARRRQSEKGDGEGKGGKGGA